MPRPSTPLAPVTAILKLMASHRRSVNAALTQVVEVHVGDVFCGGGALLSRAACTVPVGFIGQRQQQIQHARLPQALDRNGRHHALQFGFAGRGRRGVPAVAPTSSWWK